MKYHRFIHGALAALVLALSLGSPKARAQSTDPIPCDATALADAISEANRDPDPSLIELTAGCTYTLADRLPSITSDVTIQGNGATISGADRFGILSISNPGVLLLDHTNLERGFLAGYLSSGKGAAIDNELGIVVIRFSRLHANTTYPDPPFDSKGGAVYNDGTMTILDSVLDHNLAAGEEDGGYGGGIYNSGTLTVTNSLISGNTTWNSPYYETGGGGIYNKGTLLLTNSTISGNEGGLGGGLNQACGSATITNSSIVGNTANFGAAVSSCGTLTIQSSTIASNTADSYGGGIDGSVTLANTIVSNNRPDNCLGTITDGGGNLSWPDTTCPGLHANPMLGPLQFNGGPTPTLALLPGSPAIDAGLNSNCVRTDQRGYPRPVDGNGDHQPVCDIGAYEYNAYVLQSPSFEQGSDIGWTQFSNTGQELITMTRPHTGQYSAELCGRNGCMDSIQQQVTIPYNGQLRFWWYMSTQEETAEAHDGLQVQLVSEDGHVATVARHNNQDTRDTWVEDVIDVSRAAGQTVTLRFTARTDGSLPTTFWVDDVVVR